MGQRILPITPYGCLFLFLWLVGAIFLPVFSSARSAAVLTAGLAHLKQLAAGCIQYASDHNDSFPLAANGMDSISPLVNDPEAFHDPRQNDDMVGYALNFDIAGKSSEELDSLGGTVLIYETKRPGRNLSAPRSPRKRYH
ncbi:MAG: hypothetical protein P4L46_20310 [Fimbriimonas sp.]|nr:hypothetical protein [Fimbriimonas sp.]